MWHNLGRKGSRGLGHLHDLIARLEQRCAQVPQAVEVQEYQMLFLLYRATPASDDDRQLGKTDPQPLAEVARLSEAAGWYQADTEEGRRGLLHQREHFRSQQGSLGNLEL